jgi:hypothetical protein
MPTTEQGGITCPKCGTYNTSALGLAADECPSCGVIYAKAVARSTIQHGGLPSGRTQAAASGSKGKPSASLWWLAFGVAAAAVFAWKSANNDSEREAEIDADPASAYAVEATGPCMRAIEEQASGDTRFAGPFNTLVLTRGRQEPSGKLVYYGEDVQMQNALGAWRKVKFICTYDPTNQQARAVVTHL